jgi:tetratricopeptide (TPR) repeat protein
LPVGPKGASHKRLLTPLLLLALAVGIHAQDAQDPWVHDLEAGLTRARYSGSAAVVVFSAHWCGYCEKLENFFLHPSVLPVSGKAVLILVDVEAHPESLRKFGLEGHHKALVLSWDRAVLARFDLSETPDLTGEQAGKLLESLRQAVCTNETQAAEVLVSVGHYRRAVERAQGVIDLMKDGPLVERARKILDDVQQRARQELVSARELLKTGKLAMCALRCDSIAEQFPAKWVAEDLKKLRKGIEQVSRGKPAAEVLDDNPAAVTARQAKELVDRGMVAEWDGLYFQATMLYEQALKDFPGQKATDDAWARLKALREDPVTANLIKTQEIEQICQRWLQMARAYALGGHPEQARPYFERVISEYPDSEWARTAKDELTRLRKAS